MRKSSHAFACLLFSFLCLCLILISQPALAKDDCSKAAKLSDEANELVSTNPSAASSKLREARGYCGNSSSLYYNLAMALYPQAKYDEAKAALDVLWYYYLHVFQ